MTFNSAEHSICSHMRATCTCFARCIRGCPPLCASLQGPIALNQFPTGNRTPDNPLAKDSTAQAKLYNMTERIIDGVNKKRQGSRIAEQ